MIRSLGHPTFQKNVTMDAPEADILCLFSLHFHNSTQRKMKKEEVKTTYELVLNFHALPKENEKNNRERKKKKKRQGKPR